MEVKLEILRVEEIMIPLKDYPRVFEDDTLRTAIERIENCQLTVKGRKSLPRMLLVFTREEILSGLLRRRDILRGLEPEYLSSKPLYYRKKLFDVAIDPNLTELSYDRLIRGMRERAKRMVKEFMRPVPATIDHRDHIGKAIYEMVDRNVSLLPVLKGDKVVGVLRSVDVFREVCQYILE